MNKIIEKCDVCINGSVVSKELLIKTFSSFVSSTIEDKQHNVGIVLHTGSVCFDAILLSFAAISNGQAILGEVTGNSNATDSMTATVADRIKDAAVTLQIETITFVDDEVPVNTINRPITIDQ